VEAYDTFHRQEIDMTTRQLHDDCLAACAALRVADPEAHAAMRGALTIGSAHHTYRQDYDALNAVAASYVLGDRPRPAEMKRALAVLARLRAV